MAYIGNTANVHTFELNFIKFINSLFKIGGGLKLDEANECQRLVAGDLVIKLITLSRRDHDQFQSRPRQPRIVSQNLSGPAYTM